MNLYDIYSIQQLLSIPSSLCNILHFCFSWVLLTGIPNAIQFKRCIISIEWKSRVNKECGLYNTITCTCCTSEQNNVKAVMLLICEFCSGYNYV